MTGTITTMRVNPQSTSHAVGGVRGKMGPVTHHAPSPIPPPPPPQPVSSSVLPLSARKAQALDLKTVERRGGPLWPRGPGKKTSRPHNLEEAMTFKPSDEEWRNPIEYIMKIGPEASKFGIVKIIPPDWWAPDFAVDTEVRSPRQHSGKLLVRQHSCTNLCAAFSFQDSETGAQHGRRR